MWRRPSHFCRDKFHSSDTSKWKTVVRKCNRVIFCTYGHAKAMLRFVTANSNDWWHRYIDGFIFYDQMFCFFFFLYHSTLATHVSPNSTWKIQAHHNRTAIQCLKMYLLIVHISEKYLKNDGEHWEHLIIEKYSNSNIIISKEWSTIHDKDFIACRKKYFRSEQESCLCVQSMRTVGDMYRLWIEPTTTTTTATIHEWCQELPLSLTQS